MCCVSSRVFDRLCAYRPEEWPKPPEPDIKEQRKAAENPTSCGKTDGKRQAAIFPITSIKARREKKEKKRGGYHEGNSTRAARAETKLAVMLYGRTWRKACFSKGKKKCLPPAEVSELSFSAPSFSSPPCIVSVLGLVVPSSVPLCGLAPVAPGVAEL